MNEERKKFLFNYALAVVAVVLVIALFLLWRERRQPCVWKQGLNGAVCCPPGASCD